MFEPQVYQNRRARLRAALPEACILLPGHVDSPRNYLANTFDFRQNSSFLYFAGHPLPELVLLMTPDGETLFGNPVTMDDIVWTGPLPSLEELAAAAGIARVEPLSGLEKALSGLKDVHYLPPYRAESTLLLAKWLDLPPASVRARASEALTSAVAGLRLCKEPREVEQIERALAASADMYEAALGAMVPGAREQDVVAAMTGAALFHGCAQSFTPIVTIHGEVLHNHAYHNTLHEGGLLLVDSGAETAEGYASDITRTFPISGHFSTKQKEIYEVVLHGQLDAIAACAPGVGFADVHRVACRSMAAQLVQLGLLRGDVDELVAAGAHALFFPHGLGHLLGLDVHDMEDFGDLAGYEPGTKRSSQFGLNFLRMNRALRPGMVFTVEPGIYFIPELIRQWRARGEHAAFINYDRVAEYLDFGGIRIEDDILVTDTGCRVLGERPIPKTVDDVVAACDRL